MRWEKFALDKIGRSDDLRIAPFRPDRVTYGTLTWIWSVVVNHRISVRAYHGSNSRWHESAMTQMAGEITAADMDL